MMTGSEIPIARKRFGGRLALFYAMFFGCIGVYLPFFPVWLDASGFDAVAIGWVMAMPVLARLIAVPVVTRLADTRHVLRGAIIVTSLLTAAGFSAIGLMPGPLAIVVAFGLTSIVWTPVLPLTDAFALRAVMQYGIDYGPIRLWGSAAFIVGSLVAGLASSAIAPVHLVWIVAAFTVLGFGASLALGEVHTAGSEHAAGVSPSSILRMPGFILVLAAAALIQGSHAGYYTFSSIQWRADGLGNGVISVLWAIGVAAEILLFAISPRLSVSPRALLATGAAGAVLRWCLMTLEPSVGVLAAVQLLHGVSYGATQLGTMGVLVTLVPPGLTATAQGYLFTLSGVCMALAAIVAGRLHHYSPPSVYILMAVMALVSGVIIALAYRRLRAAADRAA